MKIDVRADAKRVNSSKSVRSLLLKGDEEGLLKTYTGFSAQPMNFRNASSFVPSGMPEKTTCDEVPKGMGPSAAGGGTGTTACSSSPGGGFSSTRDFAVVAVGATTDAGGGEGGEKSRGEGGFGSTGDVKEVDRGA